MPPQHQHTTPTGNFIHTWTYPQLSIKENKMIISIKKEKSHKKPKVVKYGRNLPIFMVSTLNPINPPPNKKFSFCMKNENLFRYIQEGNFSLQAEACLKGLMLQRNLFSIVFWRILNLFYLENEVQVFVAVEIVSNFLFEALHFN